MSDDSTPRGKMCHKRGTPKICDDLTVRLHRKELYLLGKIRCQVKLETLVIQFVVTFAKEVHEKS